MALNSDFDKLPPSFFAAHYKHSKDKQAALDLFANWLTAHIYEFAGIIYPYYNWQLKFPHTENSPFRWIEPNGCRIFKYDIGNVGHIETKFVPVETVPIVGYNLSGELDYEHQQSTLYFGAKSYVLPKFSHWHKDEQIPAFAKLAFEGFLGLNQSDFSNN